MLIVANHWYDVILIHAVPSGTTVNAQYYKNSLEHHLRLAVRFKRPNHLHEQTILFHNNACCHTSSVVSTMLQKWVAKFLIMRPTHPTCVPETDFSQKPLRDPRYQTKDAIIAAIQLSLSSIHQNACADGVGRLPGILQRVVNMSGDYVKSL